MTTNQEKPSLSAEQAGEQVRQAVEEGKNISREVERIARDALEMGRVEFERMKSVVENVGRGASAGASDQPDKARKEVSQAFEGLQNALLASFESARLATEEQAKRMESYYENDLKKQLKELQQMEKNMLDALTEAAKAGSDAGAAALDDLVKHARRTGTRLGEETERSMRTLSKSLPEALRETARAGFSAAREVSARAADVASGVLSGVASVLHENEKDKSASQNKDGGDSDRS